MLQGFFRYTQGLRPIRKAMAVNECYPSRFPLDHRLGIFEIPRMQTRVGNIPVSWTNTVCNGIIRNIDNTENLCSCCSPHEASDTLQALSNQIHQFARCCLLKWDMEATPPKTMMDFSTIFWDIFVSFGIKLLLSSNVTISSSSKSSSRQQKRYQWRPFH